VNATPPLPRAALSVVECAEICSLSERTIRKYVASGRIKVSRAGRRVLIRVGRVDEFLRSLEEDGSV